MNHEWMRGALVRGSITKLFQILENRKLEIVSAVSFLWIRLFCILMKERKKRFNSLVVEFKVSDGVVICTGLRCTGVC